ncbi:molybdopterin-dependent oxidoreductase [Nostocoides sp. Soil756]|jgi:DMSO/TMAO reductase YedYZ molybdopterin-dependent catalytic subunit|uniref:molybdopterin-dependent oxidoreductase n=1 Tax=Nostocoides sp. Soil756 TaxID=1736399 RepID=UPI0006FBDD64|nr:molybdopterin-dependent oxidoreductase [Tetrasphaera sp. Soil756]KRE60480.1 oxidoreductase [Tetrasphaera sp. Soil756]
MTTTPQTSAGHRPGRAWYAGGAILATAAGAGVGHLVAALVSPESSPVLAVGSTVIDATPTPVKEWAVSTFGTNDKAILIGSVAIVTLVVAGLVGVLARTRRSLGLALIGILALLALAAAAFRPTSQPIDLVPGLFTAVVGVLGAQFLFGRLDAVDSVTPDRAPGATPAHPGPGDGTSARRTVIVAAAGLGAVAAAGGAVGQALVSRGRSADIVLPTPAAPLEPLPQGLEEMVRGVSSFRTPNAEFYRIDTALVLPRVGTDGWELTIDGQVDHPFSITFDELLAMPMIEKDITLTCVSNEVGGPYVGAARWLGVPVRTLLERAGVQSGVDQILSTSTDGMTISTPLQAMTDDRDALVAVGMNGKPLPVEHGFPVRLVTPGLYGFVGSTKWLTKLTATTYAKDVAYWTERGWATDAPIYTESRIDTPRPLSTISSGRTVIGGVAWAQERGIRKVEVQVDGGTWTEAKLGPEAGIDYWRQWYLPWDALPGRHTLVVRATDATGKTQTHQRQTPFPKGATGWHTVIMTVE